MFAITFYIKMAFWKMLNVKTTKLYQQGKYSDAEKVAKRALEVAGKTFGPDHPRGISSITWRADG